MVEFSVKKHLSLFMTSNHYKEKRAKFAEIRVYKCEAFCKSSFIS